MLAYPEGQILDITGPLQIFAAANRVLGHEAYSAAIAAQTAGPLHTSCGVGIIADTDFAELTSRRLSSIDTLMVAGGSPGLKAALAEGSIAAILRRAFGRVRRIASVCTGAFLLAEAGLLDGRRAATHWNSVETLRHLYPQVEVDGDAIHIRDGDIWTSAGVTAGIDLALAMVEADHGRQTALALARDHVVYRIRPGGQSQFSAELATQSADSERLAHVVEAIRAAPDRNWHIDAIAEEARLSLRSLSRLFRRELNMSPAAFVERVRIDKARQALLDTAAPVERIAGQCGFASLRRMDRAFARRLTMSPSEFRRRFKTNGEPPCQTSQSDSFSSPTLHF